MKPFIGLTPLYDDDKKSYWILPGYMKGIEHAGGIPVMLPLTANRDMLETIFSRIDGLVLTGGHDVNPAVYGEKTEDFCGRLCPERDEMELALIQRALEKDMPVLGICRGLQIMNAALGGSLYQDLGAQNGTEIDHDMKKPYDRAAHSINLEMKAPLFGLLGQESVGVNSRHHQAIKELAPTLKSMAAAEDGIIEAVYVPDKRFFWGVQWHPEHWDDDETSVKILQAFVNACKN